MTSGTSTAGAAVGTLALAALVGDTAVLIGHSAGVGTGTVLGIAPGTAPGIQAGDGTTRSGVLVGMIRSGDPAGTALGTVLGIALGTALGTTILGIIHTIPYILDTDGQTISTTVLGHLRSPV